MQTILNPTNYTLIATLPVSRSQEITIPQAIDLSGALLLRWSVLQTERGVSGEGVEDGLLISEVEIQGLGILSSESHSVPPSTQKLKRVSLFALANPQGSKVKFYPSQGVTNSVLEIYSFIDDEITDNSDNYPMPSNNPSASVDPAILTAAILAAVPQQSAQIAAQVGAAIDAALQAQQRRDNARNVQPISVDIKPWTGNPNDHRICRANADRLGINVNYPDQPNNSEIKIATGTLAGRAEKDNDHLLVRKGTYVSAEYDDALELYAWVAPNKPIVTVTVTEYLP
jgi:hypothetical protein